MNVSFSRDIGERWSVRFNKSGGPPFSLLALQILTRPSPYQLYDVAGPEGRTDPLTGYLRFLS